MRVLALNTGSSTLKWTLLEAHTRGKPATPETAAILEAGSEPWAAARLDQRGQQIREILRKLPRFEAVGHRIVHGGSRFVRAVIVDKKTRAELETLVALDALHMRPALAGIDAVSAEFPTVMQVAAFDTAFHATLPEAAAGYALPFEWSERWGLKRFGFHGLSVQYAVAETRRLLGWIPPQLIVCHLGSGCSITAVADGKSVDTTMGFTPLEGVMMATRAGSVDPGLLLYLQSGCGIGVAELRDVLENRSGLLGVSGVSGDLRQVEAAAATSARARLAYDRFIWTLRRAVGAMAAVLGGVDTVVFTGGIGENDARVRRDVSAGLAFAGLRLDADADEPHAPDPPKSPKSEDRYISATNSRVTALVIHAREDLVILDEVLRANS